MCKSEYHKVKRFLGDGYSVFLKAEMRPRWFDYTGKNLCINDVYYKVTYKSRERGVVKVAILIYGTDFYYFYVKGRRCYFYDSVEDEESPFICVENTKEFFKYLREFDKDLRVWLERMYKVFEGKMSERCKDALKEVMARL